MKAIKNSLFMIKYVLKFCPIYAFFSIVYVVSEIVMGLEEVYVISDVVDLVIAKAEFKEILAALIRFTVILGIGLIIQSFHVYYLRHRYRNVWIKKIQRVMFDKSANIDIECFDDPKQYDLFTRALKEGDIKGIDTFDLIVNFLRSTGLLLSVGIYIVLKDPILLVLVLIQAIASFVINSKNTKLWYKASKDNETNFRRHSYIKRVFYLEKNTCDIKTTNLGNLLRQNRIDNKEALDEGYKKVEHKSFQYWLIEDIFYQIARNFFGYAYLMGKVYGLFGRKISIGVFGSTVVAINKFTNYMYGVVRGVVGIRENSMYIDDFMWLMNYKPKVEGRGGITVNGNHPIIKIENVSFKYPGQEKYAIRNVTLTLQPQEKIAIIGYNGAGKTTLIKLLLKFYDLEEGKISLNNEPYNSLDEQFLRSNYISVFQNFQIYSLSILENILFRERISEADDQLCWQALEKAGLANKVRALEKGLDTIITKEFDDEGLVLSGGEKQKLAMARVFASTAPIIVLDEPTSSLDPISEYEVNKKIIELCRDRTVIMISHRLSTIIDATKIYMFSDGEIIESGSHEQLMMKRGKYYEMFETQAGLYRE